MRRPRQAVFPAGLPPAGAIAGRGWPATPSLSERRVGLELQCHHPAPGRLGGDPQGPSDAVV